MRMRERSFLVRSRSGARVMNEWAGGGGSWSLHSLIDRQTVRRIFVFEENYWLWWVFTWLVVIMYTGRLLNISWRWALSVDGCVGRGGLQRMSMQFGLERGLQILNVLVYFMYLAVWHAMWVEYMWGQHRDLNPLGFGLQTVASHRGHRVHAGNSARAASALKCRAICPAHFNKTTF